LFWGQWLWVLLSRCYIDIYVVGLFPRKRDDVSLNLERLYVIARLRRNINSAMSREVGKFI
jgi:hypothetical protein